ncbi:AarF/ABC1/UbiB kinase family protein [Paracoccaceae bacterium]|nr:AarF/ABC1/UbiB kinase family protein [Paracoccaceae bacterium]
MDQKNSDSKSLPVPEGRISRASSFGKLAIKFASSIVFDGTKELLGGRSPSFKNLLIQEKNILTLIEELAKLRGAALKIGQLLSLEANDFLPEQISKMLGDLRNKNFHMPTYQLGEVLRENYGDNFLDNFSEFNEAPIAAASIGQVHKCKYGNEELILKIQYPKIRESIESDINNIRLLTKNLGVSPKSFDFDKLLEAGKIQLLNETDYLLESVHQKKFHHLLKTDKKFIVPKINEKLTTAKILAMEYKKGVTIDQVVHHDQKTKNAIIKNLVELAFKEIFELNLIQTDPNFANFLYDDTSKKIILLDFGATSNVSKKNIRVFKDILNGLVFDRKEMVEKALITLKVFSPHASNSVKNYLLDIIWHLSLPLRKNKEFDFLHCITSEELNLLSSTLINQKDKFQLPDPEVLFIQRKLGGIFLLGRKFGARKNFSKLVTKYI